MEGVLVVAEAHAVRSPSFPRPAHYLAITGIPRQPAEFAKVRARYRTEDVAR